MTAVELQSVCRHVIETVWRSSWQAAVIGMLVLVVQWMLRERLPARWRYNLWLLVLLRLIVPVTPAAKFSLFNLAPQRAAVAMDALPLATPIALDVSQPQPEIQRQPHKASHWPLIVASIWAAGAAAMLLRIGWASLRLSRAIRRMEHADDPALPALLRRCCDEMAVARAPIVLRSNDDFGAPALMGFWRPRLLLPAHVLETFAPAELRLIILHELAHLKRGDVAANWLVAVVQSLHWFNPVLHVVFARLRSDRELAADDMVLSITSADDRRDYGHTIVKLVETLPSRGRRLALAGTVGILERAYPLRRRITMIARFNGGNTSRRTVVAAVSMIVLAALALTDRVRGDSGATAPAAPPAAKSPASKPAATQAEDARYVAMLASIERRLPEVHFDQIPLSDAVDFLRDVTGSNLEVNWRALEAAGLDRNEPMTLRVRDARFEQVLRQLCRQAGGGTVSLGFTIDGDVIVISTIEDLAKSAHARAYDVAELLNVRTATTRPARDELVELVMANVEPDSWRGKGGVIGTVREYDGRLIVTTIDMYQLEVQRFLDELRRR